MIPDNKTDPKEMALQVKTTRSLEQQLSLIREENTHSL